MGAAATAAQILTLLNKGRQGILRDRLTDRKILELTQILVVELRTSGQSSAADEGKAILGPLPRLFTASKGLRSQIRSFAQKFSN